jgi:hypothetical protein
MFRWRSRVIRSHRAGYGPRFFKFRDSDGVEVDVATPDRSWKY